MTGDLNKWKGSDLATSPSVQFLRRGGWFISRGGAFLLAGLVIVAILLTAIITKVLTEQSNKNEESATSINSTDVINGFDYSVSNNISNTLPLSYDLQFNHSSDTFNGEMIMKFHTKNSSNKFYLKFEGKNVSSVMLECFDDQKETNTSEVVISSMNYSDGIVTIETEKSLAPNEMCSLKLTFQGAINPEEKGIFKIPYKVPVNGQFEDRWVIGANLAPNYCSLVFPCVEDEAVRVSYRLRILRHTNFSTVSNIIKKAVKIVPGFPEMVVDDYQWTPELPLSSLSYFVLPDYNVKTPMKDGPNIPVEIWYPPHLVNTTSPLTTVANTLISYFEEYFSTKLPTNRISLVIVDGLVSDISGKLGFIQISSSLLYSHEFQTPKREKRLYYNLGQKLCNLWMGNLVNFKSWSDNWINEGFALFLTDFAASTNLLNYDVSTINTIVYEKAFHDELKNFKAHQTQVINTDVKGAYLIDMISEAIEPSLFKKGIQNFLQDWMNNSTEPNALWSSLNMVQDKFDVLEFINSWNDSSPFPIVTVENKNGNVTITQDLENLRIIPITYILEEPFIVQKALMKEEKTINISIGSNKTWIVVNPHHTGFFLTNYTLELWMTLTEELLNGRAKFPTTVQSVLIHDAFTLASLGMLNYEVPLNLSLCLKNETDLGPWLTAMNHIKFIALFLNETEDVENFKVYLGDLINSSLSLIPNSEHNKNSNTRKESAESELQRWSCQFNIISDCGLETSNLGKYASCYAVRANQSTSMEEVISKSRLNIMEPYVELNNLTSLLCTSNVTLLNRILQHSLNLSDPFFSPSRTVEMWLKLKEIHQNSRTAFDYVKENWNSIYDRFKNQSEILSAILESSTYALTEEAELNEVKRLSENIRPNDKEVLDLLNNIVQQVNYNIEHKKNLSGIKIWLSNYKNT